MPVFLVHQQFHQLGAGFNPLKKYYVVKTRQNLGPLLIVKLLVSYNQNPTINSKGLCGFSGLPETSQENGFISPSFGKQKQPPDISIYRFYTPPLQDLGLCHQIGTSSTNNDHLHFGVLVLEVYQSVVEKPAERLYMEDSENIKK